MKDYDARVRITELETRLTALVAAYDELFDAVAEDLGYVAEVEVDSTGGWGPGFTLTVAKRSPRRLQKTTPPAPKPEVVRTPTARCKGKTK